MEVFSLAHAGAIPFWSAACYRLLLGDGMLFPAMLSSQTPSAKPRKPDRNWARNVWKVVADIPEGHVLTYGDVARLSGMPRYARRVSQAMRWAPRSMQLPWHRVINAQGKISFSRDSRAYEKQKVLLEAEGVVFEDGKVDLERFGYRGAVDRLLWGEAPEPE